MRNLMVLVAVTVGSTAAAAPARVATWNVESVGDVGTTQYLAALAVLERVDADVVLMQEVNGEADVLAFEALAAEAGYPYTFVASTGSFGSMRDAAMSRRPFLQAVEFTSADLSSDPTADELTRNFVRVTVDVGGNDLTMLSLHLKSSSSDGDEFRRSVEALRVVDALSDLDPTRDAVIVAGDMNEEIDNVLSPVEFTAIPAGLPVSYVLGDDLAAQLPWGLPNDPFGTMTGWGLDDPGALQLSGEELTRPSSGRRLDYLLMSGPLFRTAPETQVYDSTDEGRAGSLPLAGPRPASTASANAADHLLVFADVDVPAGAPALARPGVGDLRLEEFLANPTACPDDTGEWIELTNRTADDLDLSGMQIIDQSGNIAVVSGSVVAPAHQRVLLGRTDAARFCGPVEPDGYYGDLVYLNNTTDSIQLVVDGLSILQTPVYPAAGATPGVSAQRDPNRNVWCLSTRNSGNGDLATPGTTNSACP